MVTIPAITNLTYFMNQSFYLKNNKKYLDSHRVDLMVGQLLVTTKRAIQAAEVFRKMQEQILSEEPTHQKLVECAVYELLIADSMSPEHQQNEKMYSQKRMTMMIRGEVPKIAELRFCPHIKVPEFDSFSSMLDILPDILRFSIVCLSHRYEIVKFSALKLLRHVLETQGCSLDIGLVFILKSILRTYPQPSQVESQKDFDLKLLLGYDVSITEYLFQKTVKMPEFDQPTMWQSKIEPTSGFKRALINIYQHVLDTFISVLSSVSSHILHSIFYEVIEPTFLNQECPLEVKIFTCKIAEKIITICQGDLILSPQLLDTMITFACNQKAQLPESIDITASIQIKNLWYSIRQKVFPNYSQKGFRSLVNWLLSRLSQVKEDKNTNPNSNQDELIRNLAEVITIVAIGRQKGEEDANQLIRLPTNDKFGGGSSSELYLVLTPLIYWLEYSIDREDRLPLFQQLYQTIKDVFEGLPPGHCDLDITSIMIPSLQRTNDFLAENSPSISMLKFLDIVLTDMQKHYSFKGQKPQPPQDMQQFFLTMLSNFVTCLSYSLYEEVFLVFDKLLSLCQDNITDRVLKKCIVALVDKYTMKSKQHKATLSSFMKCLLDVNLKNGKKTQSPTSREINLDALSEGGVDNSMQKSNYFEIMAEFCFFSNFEDLRQENLKQLHFRGPLDLHDLYNDKMQFFIDSIGQMNEMHINIFTNLLTHPHFKMVLMNLLTHGETSVRLKSHEILEAVTAYFVQFVPSKSVYEFASGINPTQNEMMDAEFISHERLYISQIVIQVAKNSLEKINDCYLQFNALILLDFLFQNLLPVPTFQNEQLKAKRAKQENEENQERDDQLTMDVELLSISENTPELDVMDPVYLRMRLKLVMTLWPYIKIALNSPWSNIRSICYGLICSMLKVDVNDYPAEQTKTSFDSKNQSEYLNDSACQSRLRECVLPMLYSLLSSKESESKAGGLNILGSFCGLSYDFTGVNIHKHIAFFQRNSKFISLSIWRLVFKLQDDWDITIKEASVVLIQLCAPRNAILYFQSLKENSEKKRLEYMLKQMPRASDIYLPNPSKLQKSYIDCPVKSEHAQRAFQLFPTNNDRKEVLDVSFDEDSSHPLISLEEFMLNRNAEFSAPFMSCSQIEQDNTTLQEKIHNFNPKYEDKRLTKPHQPMSRRRQIEIELNMARGKQTEEEHDPNFFVDQYSDQQIQEIISIFRNDFKPPKNLWIEKQPTSIGTQSNGQTSQSPDFFQDIYSEAIEQFNQHQMIMQQKQQDELQQQVSSGVSSASSTNTSFASTEKTEIVRSNSPASIDSSNSDETPPPQNYSKPTLAIQPTIVQKIAEQPVVIPDPTIREKTPPTIETKFQDKLTVPIGPVGPTSPVLVSSSQGNVLNLKKSDKAEKAEKAERAEQAEKADKAQKAERAEKAEKAERAERTERAERAEKAERVERAERADRAERAELKELEKQKILLAQKIEIANLPRVSIDIKTKSDKQKLKLTENEYFESNDQHFAQLKSHTQKASIVNVRTSDQLVGYSSQPDLLSEKTFKAQQASPKSKYRLSGGESSGNFNSTNGTEDQLITRKMAQTYLSGLSQGYLSNVDNLKLIKNCLNQNYNESEPRQKQTNSVVGGKLSIKTSALIDNHLMGSLTYQSTKSQKNKKSTISNSPKQEKRRVSNKLEQKKASMKNQLKTGTDNKPVNNLADLNYFIKTIEKDLCEKFASKQDMSNMPNTPSNMLKKVGDQMRALGVDPKVWKQVEQQENRRYKQPPQVKCLALNQIGKPADDQSNCTPSNSGFVNMMNKTSSPTRPNPRQNSDREHRSGDQFCKTQRIQKDNVIQMASLGDKLKTHRESSGGYTYETNADKLSSGNGVSSNSGTKSYLINQPGILTDRSSQKGASFPVSLGKSVKNESANFFAKKTTAKSQQKFSALAKKSVFSPQMKRDPQSGGLIQKKFETNQISLKNQKQNLGLGKVNNYTKNPSEFLKEIISGNGMGVDYLAQKPQSHKNMEQGDRKTLSPDYQIGKPPLKKKKVSDASHNQNMSQGTNDIKVKGKAKNTGKGSDRDHNNYAEVYSR